MKTSSAFCPVCDTHGKKEWHPNPPRDVFDVVLGDITQRSLGGHYSCACHALTFSPGNGTFNLRDDVAKQQQEKAEHRQAQLAGCRRVILRKGAR